MFEFATNARFSFEVFNGETRTRNELLNVDNLHGECLVGFAVCAFANHAERTTWKRGNKIKQDSHEVYQSIGSAYLPINSPGSYTSSKRVSSPIVDFSSNFIEFYVDV